MRWISKLNSAGERQFSSQFPIFFEALGERHEVGDGGGEPNGSMISFKEGEFCWSQAGSVPKRPL